MRTERRSRGGTATTTRRRRAGASARGLVFAPVFVFATLAAIVAPALGAGLGAGLGAAQAAERAPRATPAPRPRPPSLSVATFAADAPAAAAAEPAPAASLGAARFGEAPGAVWLDEAAPLEPPSGDLGFALYDLAAGRLVARRRPDAALIPASVAKAPTALYALHALDPGFRFATRLLATGPIDHGVLLGDLVLVGGGDPTLDTAALARLVADLKAAGVSAVDGRFLYDDGAAPAFERIADGQPPQAAYNPGYSGLNLNFNRVRLHWRPSGGALPALSLSAEADGFAPPVDVISAEAAVDATAAFAESRALRPIGPGLAQETVEHWRIDAKLLAREGRVWLPVRRPARYAAGVFQALALEAGLRLPKPEAAAAPPPAANGEIARVESAPLEAVLRDMLDYSTNVTAEAIGLAASRALGRSAGDRRAEADLAASAAAMSDWVNARYGLDGVDAEPLRLENHSGLAVGSRASARSLVKMLAGASRDPELGPRLRAVLPFAQVTKAAKSATYSAKTGTIYFGRALAGYLDCAVDGRSYAFAILSSDLEARAEFDAAFDETEAGAPASARGWLGRARAVERRLLSDWTDRFCG